MLSLQLLDKASLFFNLLFTLKTAQKNEQGRNPQFKLRTHEKYDPPYGGNFCFMRLVGKHTVVETSQWGHCQVSKGKNSKKKKKKIYEDKINVRNKKDKGCTKTCNDAHAHGGTSGQATGAEFQIKQIWKKKKGGAVGAGDGGGKGEGHGQPHSQHSDLEGRLPRRQTPPGLHTIRTFRIRHTYTQARTHAHTNTLGFPCTLQRGARRWGVIDGRRETGVGRVYSQGVISEGIEFLTHAD